MTNYLWWLSFSKWGQSLSKLKFWPYEGRINIPIYNEQYRRTFRIYLNIIFQIYINHKFDLKKILRKRYEKNHHYYEIIFLFLWSDYKHDFKWIEIGNLAPRTIGSFMDLSGLWGLSFLCPCSGVKVGIVILIEKLGWRASIIREKYQMKLGEHRIKYG